MMQLFRIIWTSAFCVPLVGCAQFLKMLSGADEASPTAQGVSAGFDAVPDAIVHGVSALESGGWAAAAVVTALGLLKAGVTGWRAAGNASRARRLGEIAEGVKKANGAAQR